MVSMERTVFLQIITFGSFLFKGDRLLSAICNENKNTEGITENSIIMFFMTDISQGSKTHTYEGMYSGAYPMPGVENLEFSFEQIGKIDLNSFSVIDTQIVITDNPNLDHDISYEIEHIEDYQSGDNDNDNEED